ncbi:MAG: phage holin family protein [Planctomycetaceae bacterium]|nr:phage holin family protein [Planctomycetaceae bacterium]
MSSQATLNPPTGNHRPTPEPKLADGASHALHDLVMLAELQAKLLELDLKQAVQRVLRHAVLLAIGGLLLIGAVPVAIIALALTLAQELPVSLAAAYWLTLLGVVLAAGLLIFAAMLRLRQVTNVFARSKAEWRCNVQWLKDTLRGRRPAE